MTPFQFFACLSSALLVSESFAQDGKSTLTRLANLSNSNSSGFVPLVPAETGITFTNALGLAQASENQILLNGSGVAAGDVDGDLKCDLYFCSLEGGNKLFRNLGDWHFADVTSEAGVTCSNQFSTGAVFADIDGDGDLDLLVNSVGGGTRCFLNDGNGHFSEGADSGLSRQFGATSMTLADVDGDDDLDLYVANYRVSTIRSTGFPTLNVRGRRVIPPDWRDRLEMTSEGTVLEYGEPDILYLNDGHGHFSAVPWTNGRFLDEDEKPLCAPPRDWGLSAMFYDINGDGSPDLYVCNDFQTPDRLWFNNGKGQFRAASGRCLRNTATFSMSSDFADINRDGHPDFITVDMLERSPSNRLTQMIGSDPTPVGEIERRLQFERNTLHLNRGDGTFAEIACYSGIAATGWGWSAIFLDVDLDGFEDLLLTRGNMFNTQDRDANEMITRKGPYPREKIPAKLLMYPSFPESKLAFRNRGDLRFEEWSAKWGFNQVGVSQGMCLADLDNDGDLDLIANNLNDAAGVYRNNSSAPRIAVRLKGSGQNTRGIGAKIELVGGAVPAQRQEMISGGRYLSGDDAMRVFAVGGGVTNDMQLEVTWRSGKKSIVQNVRANSVYEIAEADAVVVAPQRPLPKTALFEDVSALLGHQHHEEAFDDFARQGLLPNRLSQPGPGVSWIDLNRDGHDELIIGTGKGGTLAIFENKNGKFTLSTNLPPGQRVTRDQTTILSIPNGRNRLVLLAGSSNYEDGLTNGAAVRQYDFVTGKIEDTIPGQLSSTGPLALADIDADGNLDLFVGGRVLPGRYPEPASSLLFHSRLDGKWLLDESNSSVLKEVGLVSGATWTDLNRDGYPELVLACEWGPVKIFRNEKGRLRDATREWGLDKKIGWWNGVAAGDFDGDGKMDLMVSNWGLNTKYRVQNGHGPRVYYAAWGGAGEIEPIEASFDEETQKWLPERDLNSVGRSIPFIREKFRLHREYAEAGIENILRDHLKDARILEANWLETTVFLNRGDHFDLGRLPVSAQFAPAFGVNVVDFDGDGNDDIFLSQNFFAVQPQTSRNDAGRGLLLRGDGHGIFKAVDGAESGIKVYGEQRGSAVGDYDEDGRVDLVVTQNGAATRLFHNTGSIPGLRVRLKGNAANPQALGAIMRLRFEDHWGPAREVRGGSGYWSEDSATQVLATPKSPKQIEILWPGGKLATLDLPRGGAKEVEVNQTAAGLTVVR